MTVLLFFYIINCSVDNMNDFVVYQHFMFSEFNRSWMFSRQFLPIVITLQVLHIIFKTWIVIDINIRYLRLVKLHKTKKICYTLYHSSLCNEWCIIENVWFWSIRWWTLKMDISVFRINSLSYSWIRTDNLKAPTMVRG